MDFEKAFGNFLERRKYDEAEEVLFSLVWAVFFGGLGGGEGKAPGTSGGFLAGAG